ncbi:hypothetical protein BD560DRAFT_444542 [Blakeslea trispora]|nr:hypothetical protein BD560DRAFT_444542 [Blakeslea trispora]
MLRVSSILYLEKVWSQPNPTASRETRSTYTPSIVHEESSSTPPSHPLQTETAKYISEDEGMVKDSCSQQLPLGENNAVISLSNSVSTIESGDDSPGMTNSLFSASSSVGPETPQTQQSEESVIKVVSPIPNVTGDMIHSTCDYYDDEEPSDEDLQNKAMRGNSSFSSKLSPRRILHRARSNITDEAKKGGRRRSLFLEKFSHHPLNQEIPPMPTPITNTDAITMASDANSSLAVFRRKSAKLSTKGKSLSKRIRRVISFHH